MEWCEKYTIKKYGENILLAYFFDLSKQYPSVLLYYIMVKAHLNAKNYIDISNLQKANCSFK